MNKRFNIIKINGFKGLVFAFFCIGCLAAGFLIFPGWVCMHIWNYFGQFIGLPVINAWQGLMLWAITAISGFIINDRKKFLVALKAPGQLSEDEVKTILERVKIHSQAQAINSMILKSGDVKPADKTEKSEETSEKEKENV